jgi:hypothetical protein
MLGLIPQINLFHCVAERYGFWSEMKLLEGVPFIELKLIQWWNNRLNIELVELLFEPSNGPPDGKNSTFLASSLESKGKT